MAAERVAVTAAPRARGPEKGGARSAVPRAAGAGPPRPDPLHTALQTAPAPGAAEVRALIRAQLRTALGTCAIVAAVLAGLPLLALVPAVARARVHGVPLCWLVLVGGVQPFWIAIAFRQLRRAERAERAMGRG